LYYIHCITIHLSKYVSNSSSCLTYGNWAVTEKQGKFLVIEQYDAWAIEGNQRISNENDENQLEKPH
jgi:hypothetical protein